MIRLVDFEDDKGRCDWEAYRKAQIEAGDICSVCQEYAFVVARCEVYNGPFVCNGCDALDRDPGEVVHGHFLRCPHCKKQIDVVSMFYRDPEYGKCLMDGEHDLSCPGCGKDFSFETSCSYSFKSPPLEKEAQAGTEVLP